jgi:twitching motility protein PilT
MTASELPTLDPQPRFQTLHMRRTELDYLMGTMLDSQNDVSDLNITVDKPPQVESFGELMPVELNPPIANLSPFQTEMIALNLIGGNRRLTEDLLRTGSCDASYTLSGKARFRVNIFSQRGNYSVVLRKLNTTIPTLGDLQMPEIFQKIALEKTGLVLVTGATGSGKSTTLAALLNEINETKSVHVITLEDPVEFVHQQKKATFNQREMGTDFNSFSSGLRAALRQAPKVILVGEMRDRETVEIGLSAAETGHLVLSTLHTIDAGQTINRILGMFEQEEQEQIRYRLTDTLRWIISQRLAPKVTGGRFALLEIMGSNLRTKESIVLGESEGRSFYEIIEASYPFGWRTFDHACLEAYDRAVITEETALLYCSKRGPVTRGLDNIKKQRGEVTSDIINLRLQKPSEIGSSDQKQKPASPTLKLK